MSEVWELNGTFFESCNCDAACPCIFGSGPTHGECWAVLAWHIDNGSYGDVSLDDLNVVMAAYIPGHVLEVEWQVAFYLDDRASAGQQEALTTIYSGQAGGHPAMLADFVGKVLGVRAVPIEFKTNGRSRSLSIPNVAAVAIEGVEGQDGKDVTISNHPIAVAPGVPVNVGRSSELSYRDYDHSWQLTETNGLYSAFTYRSD